MGLTILLAAFGLFLVNGDGTNEKVFVPWIIMFFLKSIF